MPHYSKKPFYWKKPYNFILQNAYILFKMLAPLERIFHQFISIMTKSIFFVMLLAILELVNKII